MKFERWQFNKTTDTDGVTWHWAEFYFRNDGALLVGKSPLYAEGASDFSCLQEDSLTVAFKLSQGSTWDEVARSFREAW